MNDTQPRETLFRRADWRAGVVAVLVAAGLAFSGVGGFGGLSGIIEKWKKADYSHGFLVVPFAAYLVWRFASNCPNRCVGRVGQGCRWCLAHSASSTLKPN